MIRKVTLYKGPIHILAAHNVHLNKGSIDFDVQSSLVENGALFYGAMGGYINLERNAKLADYQEAKDFVSNIVMKNQDTIKNLLNYSNLSSDTRLGLDEYIEKVSRCLYFDEAQLESSTQVSRREFRQLKKLFKKKRMQQKRY